MFELSPWKPARELSSLRREMDRLFEDFLGEKGTFFPEAGSWVPAVDVSETDDNILVKAELPGMDSKDIDVSVQGDILVIKGDKKEEKETKEENYHRIERRRGTFARSIKIPVPVDAENISAKYDKGVLTVTLPKQEESKAKQIEVK